MLNWLSSPTEFFIHLLPYLRLHAIIMQQREQLAVDISDWVRGQHDVIRGRLSEPVND